MFGASVLFEEATPQFRHTILSVGGVSALHSVQAPHNAHGRASAAMTDRGHLEFLESNNDRARELFGQALPLYQQIRDRYSQAVAHAWLARTTNGEQRSTHCTQLNRLAAELNLKGFHESLRAISEC